MKAKKITSSQLVIFFAKTVRSSFDDVPQSSYRKLKIGKILNGCFAITILTDAKDISVAQVTQAAFKNIVSLK